MAALSAMTVEPSCLTCDLFPAFGPKRRSIQPNESLAPAQVRWQDALHRSRQLFFPCSSGSKFLWPAALRHCSRKTEILTRRIGKGELIAMAACDAIAGAQRQYFSQAHDASSTTQYAAEIR